MSGARHVGVIDIGKTNAKVAVVDLASEREVGVLTRPNTVLAGPPYPHFDIEGLWSFICRALGELHREHTIDALSVTTHGASGVLLAEGGDLAAPVIDYEFAGPDTLAQDYDAIRPDFAETGSPRLGMGLNVGAQLYWQFKSDPDLAARAHTFLTYPQYWSYRLSGVKANEVTSLGCHTDLWNPHENRFSSLVERLGLSGKMAPVQPANACLGGVLPEVAEVTGLPLSTPVYCGLHDSNASLFPHLLKGEASFSVVSTGTWVIALAIGGKSVSLNPSRDTLVNVNAFGDPVPSARFMGGREFDRLMHQAEPSCTDSEAEAVIRRQIMLFPAVESQSGPFQGQAARWTIDEAELRGGERFAAVSFYLALVTSEMLAMIGARGPVVVEGPFTRNPQFLQMLEATTGRPVTTSKASATGTSIGAALLASGAGKDRHQGQRVSATGKAPDPELETYAHLWRERVSST